eukprot:CAMPEP_0117694456 /NCGR_PEP_ID=MMETSP0804-20121206/27479_1 /TAXON_ID=1074897 /ORGANISM="Tetraselmis astigmatica, Strain CCMP880" /LENGTH=76 /DNA_ID=CAMNT_0005508189 /DNA_START=10 /DNA_END=238 /DNA_ORIENTATION=+
MSSHAPQHENLAPMMPHDSGEHQVILSAVVTESVAPPASSIFDDLPEEDGDAVDSPAKEPALNKRKAGRPKGSKNK